MCAQTRPRFMLSSKGVLGGMEFEPMLTPGEKSPPPENVPRGVSNPRHFGSEPKHYQLSYSGPLSQVCHRRLMGFPLDQGSSFLSVILCLFTFHPSSVLSLAHSPVFSRKPPPVLEISKTMCKGPKLMSQCFEHHGGYGQCSISEWISRGK